MSELPEQVIGTAWNNNKDFKDPFVYHLEGSDQDVTLHRLDMGDLLKLGIAEEMDFMSKALIQNANEAKAGAAVEAAVKKSSNFTKMETMINSVCLAGIDSPKIYPDPEHNNAMQKGLFYISQVPWEDRMELFSVIFETEGINDFRKEQADGVGDVADVPSVPLPADGPVDIRSEDTEGVLSQ